MLSNLIFRLQNLHLVVIIPSPCSLGGRAAKQPRRATKSPRMEVLSRCTPLKTVSKHDVTAASVAYIDISLSSQSTWHIQCICCGGSMKSSTTMHFALRTSHFALCIQHSALSTPHYALCTQHSQLSTSHFALCTLHFALRTSHSALPTPALRTPNPSTPNPQPRTQ